MRRVTDTIKQSQRDKIQTIFFFVDAEEAFDRHEWGFLKQGMVASYAPMIPKIAHVRYALRGLLPLLQHAEPS